jgi:hypothetical protein
MVLHTQTNLDGADFCIVRGASHDEGIRCHGDESMLLYRSQMDDNEPLQWAWAIAIVHQMVPILAW